MLMLLERLAAVPLLLLFLVLAGCLAEHILSRIVGAGLDLGGSVPDQGTILLQRIFLGCALLVTVLFAAAATGLYQPPVLIALTAIIAVLGGSSLAIELVNARRRTARSETRVESQSNTPTTPSPGQAIRERWPLLLASGSLAFLLLCLWIHSIRPDLSWDANVYHLTLPKLFLEHGGFFSVPLNVYSHWPLATELLFGLAMAVHDYILAKQLHFVFGLLTLFTLLVAARPKQEIGIRSGAGSWCKMLAWPSLLAATLFLANPVVLFEIRIAYIDLAFAFFFLNAFLTAERLTADRGNNRNRDRHQESLDSQKRRWMLIVLGTACGLVCAVKLSGVIAALSILLVYWAASLRGGIRRSLREAPWILLPILVLASPWPIKSWLLTGNPAYPLFFELFGGPDWSVALGTQHSMWQSGIGMGRTFVDYVLLPLRVITEGGQGYEHFDGRLHLAWLFFVPLSIWSAIKNPAQRRLLGTAAIYFAAWAATSQQMRLLIPLLALLSLSGARALKQTGAPSRPRNAAGVTAVLIMVVLCFTAAAPYLRQSRVLVRDLAFLGYRAKEAVIQPIYEAIQDLPPASQLLLLNNNHGFFVERPYQADSFFEASQIQYLFASLATSQEAKRVLDQRGITHILYQRRQPGVPYPAALLALLQDPTMVHRTYESPDERYVILELIQNPVPATSL